MKISSGLRWAAAVAVMCLAAVAGAQQTVVSATALGTSSNPLVNGTIYWQPISAAKGGAGGQVLGSARSATVTSGAFSITLPDALASSPNTCYRATAIDNATGNVALGAGFAPNGIDINPGGSYGCIQPTGSTWSFDTYVPPATPPVIYVPVAGAAGPACSTGTGTCNMTVPIVLPADPTTNLQATTKQYVDNVAVPKSGGTMTGPLVLSADPTANLQSTTKQYVDAAIATIKTNVTTSTSGPVSVSAPGIYLNNGANVFTLAPISTATVGTKYSFRNYTGITNALTLQLPGAAALDVTGSLIAAGGAYASSGALGDAFSVVAATPTLYLGYPESGTWGTVAVYYVDAVSGSGSDSNPGTLASPWATVNHAASVAPSGTAILNLKLPGGSWTRLVMPYLDLKYLFVGQQGPSSTTGYDIANGNHATLHNTSWMTNAQSVYGGLSCNGTSAYGSLASTVIGNSNFIMYAVGTSQSPGSTTWGYSEGNTAETNTIVGVTTASISTPSSFIRDASTNGGAVVGPTLALAANFTFPNITYVSRNGTSGISGFANLTSAGTTKSLASVSMSTNTATLCARNGGGSVINFWRGGLLAVAIYNAYPSTGTMTAQTNGFAPLLKDMGFLGPIQKDDTQLTAGPIWVRKGPVLGNGLTAITNTQENTTVWEANAQVLAVPSTQKVFKMWVSCDSGSADTCYAESADGLSWTAYGSNPVVTGHRFNNVQHIGSTYYYYGGQLSAGTNLDCYTGSDGVHFSLAAAACLPHGSSGGWDDSYIANTWVTYDATATDGTWKMLYEAAGSVTGQPVWALGAATSTDGLTWTKGTHNPVNQYAGSIGSGPWFKKINGQYWLWSQSTDYASLPGLFRGVAPTFGDSLFQNYPQPAIFAKGSTTDESTQVADPTLVEVANGDPGCTNSTGCTWMFYSGFGAVEDIKAAVAQMPLSQIVTTSEGATTTTP